MAKQFLTPGGAFVLEDGADEYLLPGGAYLLETSTPAVVGVITNTTPLVTQALSAEHSENSQFLVQGRGFVLISDGAGEFLIPGGPYINQDISGIDMAPDSCEIPQTLPKLTQALAGRVQTEVAPEEIRQ